MKMNMEMKRKIHPNIPNKILTEYSYIFEPFFENSRYSYTFALWFEVEMYL